MGRVVVAAMGTAGDVLPALAVARHLAVAGGEVEVATHERFLTWVDGRVRRSHTLPFDPVEVLGSRSGRWLLEGGYFGVRRVAGTAGVLRPRLRQTLHALADVSRRASVLVYAGIPLGAQYVAESRAEIAVRLYLQPHWPTSENKSLYLSCYGDWGATLNRLSHRGVELGTRALFGGRHRRILKELGVGAHVRQLVDAPYWTQSETLFAIPEELAHSAILESERAHAVGFPQLAEAFAGSQGPSLEQIRSLGRPRVLMTFGSMLGRYVDRLDGMLCALAAAGRFTLVRQTGWDALRSGPHHPNVVTIGPARHDELLPEVDAVVHHGGVGTVATCLRSGRPMVLMPHWLDQFHWASTCEKLGVASVLHTRRLSQGAVGQALDVALARSDAAQSVGPWVARDDGALRAAEYLATLAA
jgi:UDP-N-acetylglucosamine:LPS N-acetylglucosamine transferase